MSPRSTKPAKGGNARGKRFDSGPDPEVERFASSAHFDVRLLPQDIRGSIAHVRGLAKGEVLTKEEAKILIRGLEEVGRDLASGAATLEPSDEDVHMAVERILTDRIGELGGKLHTGRSRNDQIATDLRLWLRDEIDGLLEEFRALDVALVDLAERHIDTLIPGYTHLQRAQPVRLAHHLLAYHEMFLRDRGRLEDLRVRMNECPLGSAALAGTAFPIDRRYTARLLDFDGPSRNSMDAVSDRDFVVEFLAAASLTMTHLSRISEEIVIWSSTEFGFLALPDSHATGSSIMPQKKNPDVAELTRGKSGRVVGSLMSMLTTLKGLPLAYNRDLQEDKEPLFDAMDTVRPAIRLLTSFLERVEVKHARVQEAAADPYLGMTELADAMARAGIPFREAHAAVGEIVRHCMGSGIDPRKLSAADLKAIHPKLRVAWLKTLDPERTVDRRTEIGGTARERVLEALARARKETPKVKATARRRILAGPTVAILAVALACGCGKRGDPLAPESAVPEPVDDLVAVARDGAVVLTWSAPQENLDGSSPPELVGFQVLHSFRPIALTDASPTTAELLFILPIPLDENDDPVIGKTFTVTDREPEIGSFNTYRVVSYAHSALESGSSNLAVVAWEVPPAAPARPRAIPEGQSVYLEWGAASALTDGSPLPGPVAYRVYRAVGEGELELLTEEPTPRVVFTDSTAPKGETLRYLVRATLPAGESWVEGPSSEDIEIIAQDLSPPPRPRNLVGSRTSRGIELRWDAVEASDLAGYHIQRKVPGGRFTRINDAPIVRTGFRDEQPPSGPVIYRVLSVDRSERANMSAPSPPIRVD